MKRKTKSKADARGGLAAEAKQMAQESAPVETPKRARKPKKKAKAVAAPKSVRLEKIFGFAPTAVLRQLGKEGVTIQEARAIMKAKGIDMPTKSIDVQVSLGRSGARPPASLTPAQVQDLKALAA